jgi:hypothetical protein
MKKTVVLEEETGLSNRALRNRFRRKFLRIKQDRFVVS